MNAQKKKLISLYTRADAIRAGHTTRAELGDLLGDAKLHSLQHWQAGANRSTLIYAFGPKQLAAVRDTHLAQVKKLGQEIARLKRRSEKQNRAAEARDDRITAQEQELGTLRHLLQAAEAAEASANAKAEEARRDAELAQRNMDQMSRNAVELPLIRALTSPTGKSASHLVLDAAPLATGAPFVVQPANGMPGLRRRRRM